VVPSGGGGAEEVGPACQSEFAEEDDSNSRSCFQAILPAWPIPYGVPRTRELKEKRWQKRRRPVIKQQFCRIWPALLCASGVAVASQAQHVHSAPDLPVLVDGAKTPDRIPDELAYAHFLVAVAVEEDAPEEDRNRQAALLLPLDLEANERQLLVAILGRLKLKLNETEASLRDAAGAAQDPQTSRRVATILEQRKQAIAAAVAEIRRSLSPSVVDRLDRHIQNRVKPKIVIYGSGN